MREWPLRLTNFMALVEAFTALFLLGGVLSCVCLGNEICSLANGFQIEAVSHTTDHGHLILRTETGLLEFPLSDVAKIEAVPDGGATAHISGPSAVSEALSTEQALRSAAETQGLPAAFVRSVARAESGYNQNAISAKGAIGLMQLMPATAVALGVEPRLLNENAQGGAKYLRELLVRYNGNAVLALAAYNAGPNAVNKYGGIPPYTETRRYVERVLREYVRQRKMSPTAGTLAARASASKPSATD